MKNDPNYPTDSIHILAENDPGFKHNTFMLNRALAWVIIIKVCVNKSLN